MNRKQLLYISALLFLSFWGMTGCKKEEKLTPTTAPEDIYSGATLPQGNHPYDATIQQLFSKYNTLFLYKYQPGDLYYAVTYSNQGIYDTATNMITKPGWFDVPADQQYVGMQLDLLKSLWLNYYPDSLLRQGLPQKVYLLDSFYNAYYPYPYTGPGSPGEYMDPSSLDMVYTGVDYIMATWGAARIATISQADKYTFKSRLNTVFLSIAHAKGAITRSASFTALTDYSAVNYTNYNALGIIDYWSSIPDKDWDAYVTAIVSNSYTTLTSPGNILDPAVDVNGVIRQKYNLVLAYFQSAFGVDLQAIGNAGS